MPRSLRWMLVVAVVATLWSLIHVADFPTWVFELSIGGAGVIILALTWRRFRFTPLFYGVVAAHYVILAIGAKYTYSEMPLFNWLRDTFDLSRNHFDRVGHFAQGVTPALLAREFLLRTTALRPDWLTNTLAISVALAFSAWYEILEWLCVIAFYDGKGLDWLGMQGDQWDTQADMLMALCGALTATLLFRRIQDRQIAVIGTRRAA